jgi:hypothetical protein
VGAQTGSIRDRFDGSGQAQPIAGGLNRTLTIRDFAAQDRRLAQLDGAVRAIDPATADNLLAANFYTDFDLQVSTVLSAYEYGIRDWLNVGIRVPVMTFEGHARFSAQTVNNANAARARLGSLSREASDGLRALAAQSLDTAYFQKKVFAEKGYEAPHDFNITELGDAELGAKLRFYNGSYWVSSLTLGTRAPTGSRASRTNIFDAGSGNGAWAAAAQAFNDFYPLSWLTLGSNLRAGYTFPDRFGVAVPKDASDALPSARDQDGQWQEVLRRQGFEFLGEVSATARLDRGRWQGWGAFQFYDKGQDSYFGDGPLYYQGLSDATGISYRSLELGAGYSSVPDFLARKAKVPFEANVLYNWVVAGRNWPVMSYARVDLIGYF